MPPVQDDDATSILRSLKMRSCISSKPIVSTSHFIRARSLLSRFEKLEKTRKIDSSVAMRSSRDVNSSRASAGCGLAPRPPATNTRKPGSTVPSGRVRFAAITPMSLNLAWPQSVSDRKSVVEGKRVSVSVYLGGRRILKKKKRQNNKQK